MNICHLVTKGFDGDMTVRRSITYNGTPLTVGVTHTLSNDVKEETVEFNKSLPDEVNAVKSLNDGKQELIDSPIGSIINSNGNILSLSSIYDYRVTPNDPLSAALPVGTDFDTLAEGKTTKEFLL